MEWSTDWLRQPIQTGRGPVGLPHGSAIHKWRAIRSSVATWNSLAF